MSEVVQYKLKISRRQEDIFFPEIFPKFTIVPKGRRAGLTKGAAYAFIEYGFNETLSFLPPGPLLGLWGDTVAANIDKYIDRYFLPELKKIPDGWRWKAQDRELTIGRLKIDFRSADRPENWEGFGYHIIFLNEAGIILEDDYLFDNAVLPMLVDFPNAKLIAAGVPKGKRHKNGKHKFYQLYEEAKSDKEGRYRILKMTGYNNPFISHEELDIIASTMDDETRKQEIDGEFVDLAEKKFLYAFREDKHVIPQSEFTPNPHLPILISYDFNVEPMTATVSQQVNLLKSVMFDEFRINVGSVEEINEQIKAKYIGWLNSFVVTGDATGRNREKVKKGNINAYRQIKDDLDLLDRDLVVPSVNPAHKDSRQLCNSVLQNAEFYITDNCEVAINDAANANVDDKGDLIKTVTQGLHLFDNIRYTIHAFYPDFITNPEKYRR